MHRTRFVVLPPVPLKRAALTFSSFVKKFKFEQLYDISYETFYDALRGADFVELPFHGRLPVPDDNICQKARERVGKENTDKAIF